MAYDKIKYNTEFNKEKYDETKIRFPKGYKEEITKFYEICGYTSMNSYITTLIQNDMDIIHKKLNELSPAEQRIIQYYRLASATQKEEFEKIASQVDLSLSDSKKEKLYNLRKSTIEKEVKKNWLEDFGKEKLPKFIIELVENIE